MVGAIIITGEGGTDATKSGTRFEPYQTYHNHTPSDSTA
jgi:hypothetical protein